MNFVFFMQPRSGSMLLLKILTQRLSNSAISDPTPAVLPLVGDPVPFYHPGTESVVDTILTPPTMPHASGVYVGSWWGATKEVPEPYEVDTPSRWSAEYLKRLPDTVFFSLIRDGRNKLASHRSRPGNAEVWDSQKFEWEAAAWRNIARVMLDCQKQLPNYHLIRFEDFVADPLRTLESFFAIHGHALDVEKCTQLVDRDRLGGIANMHSSFGGVKRCNDRYRDWSITEQQKFTEIAGRELGDLGYL
jgi:hypothetical protein